MEKHLELRADEMQLIAFAIEHEIKTLIRKEDDLEWKKFRVSQYVEVYHYFADYEKYIG